MPPEDNDTNTVSFFVGGKKIGVAKASSIFNEPTDKLESIGKIEGTLTIEEPFYVSPALLESMMPMDITVRELGHITKRPRSKKKRIQKKWLKRNTLKQTTYKNCTITEVK